MIASKKKYTTERELYWSILSHLSCSKPLWLHLLLLHAAPLLFGMFPHSEAILWRSSIVLRIEHCQHSPTISRTHTLSDELKRWWPHAFQLSLESSSASWEWKQLPPPLRKASDMSVCPRLVPSRQSLHCFGVLFWRSFWVLKTEQTFLIINQSHSNSSFQ